MYTSLPSKDEGIESVRRVINSIPDVKRKNGTITYLSNCKDNLLMTIERIHGDTQYVDMNKVNNRLLGQMASDYFCHTKTADTYNTESEEIYHTYNFFIKTLFSEPCS